MWVDLDGENMKVAIYAIAKDEAKNAESFLKSCSEADEVIVGDTGSTDITSEILRGGAAVVHELNIRPWRFDIARNAILALVPPTIDVCLRLDLDERPVSGWRDALESSFRVGQHHRACCSFVNEVSSGSASGVAIDKHFIHTRFGYVWRHRVHERLYFEGEGVEKMCAIPELVIEHHQDRSKSRNSYLSLLEAECQEASATAQHLFWLGREYIWNRRWDSAEEAFHRFLKHPQSWQIERARAMQYLADIATNRDDDDSAHAWHLRACCESPDQREPWVDLARFYERRQEWAQAYAAVQRALSIRKKPRHYLVDANAWNGQPSALADRCLKQLK
jgi:tetratricopeptide (TPR) repeat protein